MKLTALFTLALLSTSAMAELTEEQKKNPLEVAPTDPKLAKIILLAGSPSGKPGDHEYFAGSVLLRDWLLQSPGTAPVLVANGWPKDEAILDGARAIVVYADCGVKLPYLETSRFEKMRSLMGKGTGLVMLHQAGDVPISKADETKQWLGAVWQTDIGCRGHWDMSFSEFPKHAITQGMTSFTAPFDGWLYNYHFAEGVVPLLTGMVPDKFRTTVDAKTHNGRAETIAWAYERPAGGRSFGFSGAHLHKNWTLESQRKLVINGILWTANLPVPATGAPVECKAEDLSKNLDAKPAGGVKNP
jgi:hypothetical protein